MCVCVCVCVFVFMCVFVFVRVCVRVCVWSRSILLHPFTFSRALFYLFLFASHPTAARGLRPLHRREVYAICCEHDIIILEDDPYYYLQYSAPRLPRSAPPQLCLSTRQLNGHGYDTSHCLYIGPSSSSAGCALPVPVSVCPTDCINCSLFSMDVEGRVLRFDSFSKIVSSGIRVRLSTPDSKDTRACVCVCACVRV